jgi:hypothetical protein
MVDFPYVTVYKRVKDTKPVQPHYMPIISPSARDSKIMGLGQLLGISSCCTRWVLFSTRRATLETTQKKPPPNMYKIV